MVTATLVFGCAVAAAVTSTQLTLAAVTGDFEQVGSDVTGAHEPDWGPWSVALSNEGNRVVIGEPFYSLGDVQAGRARVFDFDGADWTQAGADVNGTRNLEEFGAAVALSGDGSRLAASGAACSPNDDLGYVRVLDWDGTAWNATGDDIVEPVDLGCWGQSLAMSDDGTRLALAAPFVGQVYTYDINGSGWVLAGPPLEVGDFSTLALSRTGDHLAVGVPGTGTSGYATVYAWDGSAWVKIGDDIDSASGERFGSAVAISDDGSRIAVSAPHVVPGVVRLYDWNGAAWLPTGDAIVGGGSQIGFGHSLGLSGDGNRLAISGEGAVGLYDWTGAMWAQRASFIDRETPAIFDPPQAALARDGSRLAITRPVLRVFEGPVADAPATTTTTTTTAVVSTSVPEPSNTLPATGSGASTTRATVTLAAALLACGLSAIAAARRRTITAAVGRRR